MHTYGICYKEMSYNVQHVMLAQCTTELLKAKCLPLTANLTYFPVFMFGYKLLYTLLIMVIGPSGVQFSL